MEAIECIMSRRSIRKFTDVPASEAQIDMVLRAAMAAPSAGNQQPWRFVVLTERDALNAAAATTPYGKMLESAAFGLIVCGDTSELKHPTMWEQDCSAAVQNALLAAHALGLGAVWLGFWPKMERVEPLKRAFSIPEGVEPLAVIAFGDPAEEKGPANRHNSEFVHRDTW